MRSVFKLHLQARLWSHLATTSLVTLALTGCPSGPPPTHLVALMTSTCEGGVAAVIHFDFVSEKFTAKVSAVSYLDGQDGGLKVNASSPDADADMHLVLRQTQCSGYFFWVAGSDMKCSPTACTVHFEYLRED